MENEQLEDGWLVRTIFEALWQGFLDAWYVWLLMLVLFVAVAWLKAWSDRVVARRKAERRARERASDAATFRRR